jgi:predicted porin
MSMMAGLALVSPTVAQSPDVYGRINVTLQNSDEITGEKVELRNNSSRLGVKGELVLTAGLKAIYQLEFGVNIDGDTEDDTFTHRNQFAGLEGAFGTIKVGRHDTALKEAQGDFDLFDDLEGDIAGVFNGENRLRNYLGYTTPRIGAGFHFTANFFPGEESETGDGALADGTSFSLEYEADALFVALAHDQDIDGEGVQTTRAVGGYKLGAAQIMLLYQLTDSGAGESDGFGTSLAWTRGKYTAKFQFLDGDQWRAGLATEPPEAWYESSWSVGLDRALGEDTLLFGFFTRGDFGNSGESNRYVAIGLEHDF